MYKWLLKGLWSEQEHLDMAGRIQLIFLVYLPDPDVVVLPEVEQHGGEVGRYESVDSTTGPGKEGARVREGGPQTARYHSGHVDHQDLGGGEGR